MVSSSRGASARAIAHPLGTVSKCLIRSCNHTATCAPKQKKFIVGHVHPRHADGAYRSDVSIQPPPHRHTALTEMQEPGQTASMPGAVVPEPDRGGVAEGHHERRARSSCPDWQQ